MIKLFCFTHVNNLNDIEAWLQYHSSFIDHITILDNNSPISVVVMSELAKKYKSEYFRLDETVEKWSYFEQILNKKTQFLLKNDDFVCFFDQNEYLFAKEYEDIENVIKNKFRQLDCIMLPEILMSTRRLKKKRNELLPNFCTYRRPDLYSRGKAIIWWNDYSTYSFTLHDENRGYIPWINKCRYSDVINSTVSKDIYGETPKDIENQPLAVINYRIQSEDDWKTQHTDIDIHEDYAFDNYTIQDFTMKNQFNKIIQENYKCQF